MIPTEPGYYWAFKAADDISYAERSVVQVYREGGNLWVRHQGKVHTLAQYRFLTGPLPKPGPSEDAMPGSDGPETGPASEPNREDDQVRQLSALIERTEAIIARSEALADRAMGPIAQAGSPAQAAIDAAADEVIRGQEETIRGLRETLATRDVQLEHRGKTIDKLNDVIHRLRGEEGGAKAGAGAEDEPPPYLLYQYDDAPAQATAGVGAGSEDEPPGGPGINIDDLAGRVQKLEMSRHVFRAVNESLKRRIDALEAKAQRDISNGFARMSNLEEWAKKFASLQDERFGALEEARETQDDAMVHDLPWDLLRRVEDLEKVDRGPGMAGAAIVERIDELARRLGTHEEVDANILRTIDRLEGRTKYLQGWAETIRIMEDRLKQLIEHMREFGRWSDAAGETKK